MEISELTLKEKIGQMFIVGIEGKKVTPEIKKLILDYKIGGIVLYKKNFNTYNELINLVNELKELNKNNKIPLFISIDQEGGRVNRMPKEINNIYNARKIAKTGNMELLKTSAKLTGEMLNKSGINMNFSPVLDIQRFSNNHAIGNRSYGDNFEDVSRCGILIMKTFSKENVIPVIKHFPGHGATTKDSHYSLPVIKSKYKDLEKTDIVPFKKAIENDADAIMMGHLLVKDIDSILPASLSFKMIKKLRIDYHYKGLIITDDLKMKAISLIYGYKLATKLAIKAGNDIVMLGVNFTEQEKVFKSIIRLVKKATINENRINRSVSRIVKLKEKYKLSNEYVEGINIEQLNQKINILNEQIDKE